MHRLVRTVGIGLLVVLLVVGPVQGVAASLPGHSLPGVDTIDENVYADYDEDEELEEEDEAGARILREWWGLGGEADEAPYLGLAELGVSLLLAGVLGYSAGKRTSVVPLQYRKRLLQAHEWSMLAGTALVVPHFLAVEEWEGLGLLVALLLVLEVASGLYGRHLHRHALRLGRGEETPRFVGRFLSVTKRSLLSRWRQVHVLMTVVTALVLVLHVVTAIAD